MNKTHTVSRICCVCRKLLPITDMTRVVRVSGSFFVQGEKRLNGRGAHVCSVCLKSPNLQKSLNRSFKTQLPVDIFQQLIEK
ncbi:MAG: YlxR family protein [Clostridia bacterium]|nr:YlxR family protein [Clostridia bacterium]